MCYNTSGWEILNLQLFNLIARKYKMTISSTKTKSMATWGNHIQRVKIEINDNIIE